MSPEGGKKGRQEGGGNTHPRLCKGGTKNLFWNILNGTIPLRAKKTEKGNRRLRTAPGKEGGPPAKEGGLGDAADRGERKKRTKVGSKVGVKG